MEAWDMYWDAPARRYRPSHPETWGLDWEQRAQDAATKAQQERDAESEHRRWFWRKGIWLYALFYGTVSILFVSCTNVLGVD